MSRKKHFSEVKPDKFIGRIALRGEELEVVETETFCINCQNMKRHIAVGKRKQSYANATGGSWCVTCYPHKCNQIVSIAIESYFPTELVLQVRPDD